MSQVHDKSSWYNQNERKHMAFISPRIEFNFLWDRAVVWCINFMGSVFFLFQTMNSSVRGLCDINHSKCQQPTMFGSRDIGHPSSTISTTIAATTTVAAVATTGLTHWGRDKMAAIFQTTSSSAFSWMKMFEWRLKLQWSLFLRVQLTIFQQWFR